MDNHLIFGWILMDIPMRGLIHFGLSFFIQIKAFWLDTSMMLISKMIALLVVLQVTREQLSSGLLS